MKKSHANIKTYGTGQNGYNELSLYGKLWFYKDKKQAEYNVVDVEVEEVTDGIKKRAENARKVLKQKIKTQKEECKNWIIVARVQNLSLSLQRSLEQIYWK